MTDPDLAQYAYDAYAKHQGWKNYAGNPLPAWSEVGPDIQAAWDVAVQAVLEAARANDEDALF